MAELTDQNLLRYSRQIMVPAFDVGGQKALGSAQILIVGLGGLGSAVALYLAASGIGHLVLADNDKVELSNLPRQIIYRNTDVGVPKALAATRAITALNPDCQVVPVAKRLTSSSLDDYCVKADLVVDCTDNFSTRSELNAACLKHKRPLVSAAAIRMEGQITVFDARKASSPCYRCLHETALGQEQTCSETGIMAPVVGLLGTAQAMEAIKLIAGFGEPLIGRLLTLDATNMTWRSFRLPKRVDCPACALY